jgi:hypothetical protein
MKICEELPRDLGAEDHAEAYSQDHCFGRRVGPQQSEHAGQNEGGNGSRFTAEALQRVDHEGAGAREGKRHPENRVQRLGDREAALGKDVGQPGAEPEGDAEKRKEADHSGNDPVGIVPEHGRDTIAVGVVKKPPRMRAGKSDLKLGKSGHSDKQKRD